MPRCSRDFSRMWDVKDKWRALDVLIIDEISMISAELLDYLEQTISKIRYYRTKEQDPRSGNKKASSEDEKPFGGLQVYLV